MSESDLINYILKDRQHTLSEAFRSWFATCERFEGFVILHKDKIRKKVGGARGEGLEDLRLELELPYLLLLDDRFKVEYEKYAGNKTTSPDFSITFDHSTHFSVEVKRIREADLGRRFSQWIEKVVSRIEAIPSGLAFRLHFPEMESTSDPVDRLEASTEEIISYIENTILTEGGKLSVDSEREFSIPGFQDEMVLTLSKPPHKQDSGTSYHGGIGPIFYTKKEFKKFSDLICDLLLEKQVRPGMINLLFLSTNSTTHEDKNLPEAIHQLHQCDEFFIKKGFKSRQDFLDRSKSLSGILFRSSWMPASASGKNLNFLWLNGQAEYPIPEPIQNYLTNMGKRQ